MNYYKTNTLDDTIIDRIADISSQNNYEPFYVPSITGNFKHFHYITDNDNLVSFLGIMPLSDNSVEITGITVPAYRNRGHFTTLLKNALTELNLAGHNIYCEKQLSFPFLKTTVEYCNLLMFRPFGQYATTNTYGDFSLEEYTYEYEEFTEFIYVLIKEDTPIGLLKIHTDATTACIHHVQIRKPFRNRGFGKILLNNALTSFEKENSHDLMLHVQSNNVAAVRLYTGAGFDIIESLKYYRINYFP